LNTSNTSNKNNKYFDKEGKLDFGLLPPENQQFLNTLSRILGKTIKKIVNEINTDIIVYECKLKEFKNDDEKITFIQANLIERYRKELDSKSKSEESENVEPDIDYENIPSDIEFILKSNNLLVNTVKAVRYLGVIGEGKLIIAETIVICSSDCINVKPTSRNLHPEDDQGVGKDYVSGKVIKVVHPERVIHIDNPSPTALTYTGGNNFEAQGNSGSIRISRRHTLYIEDASDEFLNKSDFRLLLSKETIESLRTVNQQSVLLNLPKPGIIITTADTKTDSHLLRRLPSAELNKSQDQTKRIIENQDKRDSIIPPKNLGKLNVINGNERRFVNKIIQCYKYLKQVYVVIPKEVIDKKEHYQELDIILRTMNQTFNDYIKISTAIHQYNRKHIGTTELEGYTNQIPIIEATDFDLKIAKTTMDYLFGKKKNKFKPLNSRQKKIEKFLKTYPDNRYTIPEIKAILKLDVHSNTIRGDVDKLVKYSDICLYVDPDRKVHKYYWKHEETKRQEESIPDDLDGFNDLMV